MEGYQKILIRNVFEDNLFSMLRKIIPLLIPKKMQFFKKIVLLKKQELRENKALKSLSGRNNIKVAFILINESMWKYKELYFLLKQDKQFEPWVFICPFISSSETIMMKEMEGAFSSFRKQGYNVVKSLKEDGTYLDLKNEFHPDLVFFSSPWDITLPQYGIDNYLDKLTCYVNYSYTTSTLFRENYNRKLHNFCWKYFLESDSHKAIAEKYSDRKGKNTIVTGYAGTDVFLATNYVSKEEVWKKQDKRKKRIIWAPHHSVEGNITQPLLNYATFLRYYDFIFSIAEKYKDSIQFAFKPHPYLKGKLYRIWGEVETENYYKKWQELPNGQLEEKGYIDLFLQSDAMIHDSSSFLIEYLFIHKPVLYLINNEESEKQYNEIGQEALAAIKLAYSEQDILDFINLTVIRGNDSYREKREKFFDDNLRPPHNRLASENIYYYLIEKLNLI